MAVYKVTKFGISIATFPVVWIRIISPNRGLVLDAVQSVLVTKDGNIWNDTSHTISDTTIDVTNVWDNSCIAGVYDEALGVHIFTIPTSLPAGNDYDVLFYSTDVEGEKPYDGDSPYDGRKMVWSGDHIVSLTDYVGNSVVYKYGGFGDGLGF